MPQRANSGANSETVRNPVQANAPLAESSPLANLRASRIAAMLGISGPSIAGVVSCHVRRMRSPRVRSPTTLTHIPPLSPAIASNQPRNGLMRTPNAPPGTEGRSAVMQRGPTGQGAAPGIPGPHGMSRSAHQRIEQGRGPDLEHCMRRQAAHQCRAEFCGDPSIPMNASTFHFAKLEMAVRGS